MIKVDFFFCEMQTFVTKKIVLETLVTPARKTMQLRQNNLDAFFLMVLPTKALQNYFTRKLKTCHDQK
jgi:hypothetical protein